MQDTVIATTVGNMFICSEIEAKSFGDRSQEIWDQLLAFRALIIEKNALLTFTCFEDLNKLSLFALSHFVSRFVLFCSPSKSFCRPN